MIGYDAGSTRPPGGIAVVVADEERAPKKWRRVVLSILQSRFGCSLVFGVGLRFNLVAAGDICRLDGTENHSGKKVRVTVVHHFVWGGEGRAGAEEEEWLAGDSNLRGVKKRSLECPRFAYRIC